MTRDFNSWRVEEFVFSSEIDRESGILMSSWEGRVSGADQAKSICMEIVQLLGENHLHKVLNDNRKQIGMWPDMSDWLYDYWFPALRNAGLRSFAHVMSADQSTNESAMRVFNQIHCGVEFVTFSSFESAVEWLKSQ